MGDEALGVYQLRRPPRLGFEPKCWRKDRDASRDLCGSGGPATKLRAGTRQNPLHGPRPCVLRRQPVLFSSKGRSTETRWNNLAQQILIHYLIGSVVLLYLGASYRLWRKYRLGHNACSRSDLYIQIHRLFYTSHLFSCRHNTRHILRLRKRCLLYRFAPGHCIH